jgi:hypothetical protein
MNLATNANAPLNPPAPRKLFVGIDRMSDRRRPAVDRTHEAQPNLTRAALTPSVALCGDCDGAGGGWL